MKRFSANPRPAARLAAALFALVLAVPARSQAEPVAAAKAGDHLFHPTPRAQMRDLSTDRPDQTESPYTVDAGHVQVEMDFFHYTHDVRTVDGGRTKAWSFAPLNVKIGLHTRVDLQLLFDTHSRVRTRGSGENWERAAGFGDLTTRLKINLWGNDGGPTALAIMPFLKLPLPASDLRNGSTEGGLIIPLAVALPGGWSMGVMTEVDFVKGRGGYDTEWLNSITFSHALTERLGFYAEFAALTGTAPGFRWQAQADTGLTYAWSDDVQFDCGCNFGLTRSAPDYQPFAGVTVRF